MGKQLHSKRPPPVGAALFQAFEFTMLRSLMPMGRAIRYPSIIDNPKSESSKRMLTSLTGITIALSALFFPRRVGNAMGWLMDRTLSRFWGTKEDEKRDNVRPLSQPITFKSEDHTSE